MSSPRSPGRRPKKYSQAARLHDLIRILEMRYGATVSELVEECDVTRRTVYRDLQALMDAGYPLISDRQADGQVVYRFMTGFSKIPPLTLSVEELMTLYLCRGQLDFLHGTPFQEDLDAIFARLRSMLPPRTVAHLERVAEASCPRFQGYKDYSAQYRLLGDLRQALLSQRRCLIHYRPAQRATTTYLIDPYTLLFYNNGLYVCAYAHNRDGMRIFAIDRIEQVALEPQRFEVPQDYAPGNLTGTAFGLIDDGVPHDLVVHFASDIAHLVAERIWHPQQRIEEQPDGSLVLRFRASGDKELLAWLYSFVPHVRIVAPAALRHQFIEGLQSALQNAGTAAPGVT
ncbi:MAG: WYL domain-containing protein [Pelovirga sp.]